MRHVTLIRSTTHGSTEIGAKMSSFRNTFKEESLKNMIKKISLLAAILLILTTKSKVQGQEHQAFINVHIPSLMDDQILRNQTVEIKDGKIIAISPTASTTLSDDVIQIDGTDQYLIPGLAEMHAHIPTPKNGSDDNVRETLFLYLANGITTIRGMLGHPYHLALREYVKSNPFPSPRIFPSSPSMNGNSIPTKEIAEAKVRQYAADGYDFLKVHPGIKREVFDVMVKTADEVGISFSGHVPMDVGIRHAIASKYASIDHLDGYITGLAPEEKKETGGFFGVMLYDDLDHGKIDELVQATKRAGVAIVPTQTLMTRWLSPRSAEEMVNEPEMKYISPSLRFSWRQGKERMLESLTYREDGYHHFVQTRSKIIKSLFDEGVPILLGSDAPQVMNVPGFSLHHEMEDMAQIGLTPRAVLRSGSSEVAKFFDQSDEFGSVAVGLSADLILLRENPVENISLAREINGVMYRGHWMSKESIDEKLKQIEQKYQ